jgi:hypothetical protein
MIHQNSVFSNSTARIPCLEIEVFGNGKDSKKSMPGRMSLPKPMTGLAKRNKDNS